MKKPLLLVFALICLLTLWLLAETLVVKIQATNLRREPKFYAGSVAALKSGDVLERISSQGGWIQVKTAGGSIGWVHSSAVETKKFGLLALDKNLKTQASASEIALAGKGFNKQVEESYRAKHAEMSFVWVDKMAQLKIPLVQVEEFLKKGKLAEFRGGK